MKENSTGLEGEAYVSGSSVYVYFGLESVDGMRMGWIVASSLCSRMKERILPHRTGFVDGAGISAGRCIGV